MIEQSFRMKNKVYVLRAGLMNMDKDWPYYQL